MTAGATVRILGIDPGLRVTGFGAALVGSLIYSLAGVVIDVAIERVFAPAAA